MMLNISNIGYIVKLQRKKHARNVYEVNAYAYPV